MSLDFTDDQFTLVQVMTWCRQATSHYLSQCWPRSLSPYGVTRPEWVKFTTDTPYLALMSELAAEHKLNSQQKSHTLPSWASYGLFIVRILEKIDCIVFTLKIFCIELRRQLCCVPYGCVISGVHRIPQRTMYSTILSVRITRWITESICEIHKTNSRFGPCITVWAIHRIWSTRCLNPWFWSTGRFTLGSRVIGRYCHLLWTNWWILAWSSSKPLLTVTVADILPILIITFRYDLIILHNASNKLFVFWSCSADTIIMTTFWSRSPYTCLRAGLDVCCTGKLLKWRNPWIGEGWTFFNFWSYVKIFMLNFCQSFSNKMPSPYCLQKMIYVHEN